LAARTPFAGDVNRGRVTFPHESHKCVVVRPAVAAAILGIATIVEDKLTREMQSEKTADREYWLPLKRELERLQMDRK
jgi:hypothetical protein